MIELADTLFVVLIVIGIFFIIRDLHHIFKRLLTFLG